MRGFSSKIFFWFLDNIRVCWKGECPGYAVCSYLLFSDWKVEALQLLYDLGSCISIFSYSRTQSPAVLSWRTIETGNVVSGLSERDECLFRCLIVLLGFKIESK